MQSDYDESVRKLLEKHEADRRSFETNAALQRATLLQQRQGERTSLINRQRKVEHRGEQAKDKDKIWNLEQFKFAAAISRDVLNRSHSRGSQPARTSRLRSTVAPPLVSAEGTSTTLELPPLNMVRPRKAETARTGY
jgi:hypothetical protein